MTTYYLSAIETACTNEGDPVHNGIAVTVRDGYGHSHVLRLIPGYDSYLTAVIVNNGEYGFYRFDRRLRSMSDEAEIRGLGLLALRQILRECQRNLKSKDNGIYFLEHMVGEIQMPLLFRDNYRYSVKNKAVTLMSLVRWPDNRYEFGFTTTLRAMFHRLRVKVTRINAETMNHLLALSRQDYGKKCNPSFTNLLSK